jgi:hypothetical protein
VRYDPSAGAGADLSECGRYRYRLWREVDPDNVRSCLFLMLNPSTADATVDDPTIRKCIGFCKRWGYGRLFVVNLFAFRSTSPAGLLGIENPSGPDNDAYLEAELACAHRVVFAWGSHHEIRHLVERRMFEVRRIFDRHPVLGDKTVTFGRCKDGNPRHPLMLPYAAMTFSVDGKLKA